MQSWIIGLRAAAIVIVGGFLLSTHLLAAPSDASGSASQTSPVATEPPVPDARPEGEPRVELHELSPQGSVRAYLEACRDGRFDDAARFLDLGGLPASEHSARGPRLARQWKHVLDQTLWIDLDALSTDVRGRLDDGLAPDLELVDTIRHTRTGPVAVTVQWAPEARVWRFTRSTVARIPALHAEYGYGMLAELFPNRFSELSFLEVQLWQWIGSLVLLLVAAALSWALTWVLFGTLKPVVLRTRSTVDDELLALTVRPVRFGVGVGVAFVLLPALHLSVPAHEFGQGVLKGLAVLATAWLFLRVVDVVSGVLREKLQRDGKTSAVAALPLGEKTVKVFLLGCASIALLQNLGFNVTGLIAGLGVGGLAVALAAQKTVENLFGGVSLIVDQPVRVGDFCRYGEKIGTVEDVGLRTTKVRTLDRTVVSVPNAEFAHMQLENFARRDKIRFHTKLGLRYETSADQLRWVLAELKRLLVAHPRVDPDPARVRFVGYGDFSLDLEVFAYVKTQDFNEYLGIQEDLLLRIMDVVNASGTGFAFPSTTTYLARDGGTDAERTSTAEAAVRAWRETGRLPFPDDAPDRLAALDDTLEFPPRGSALASR